MREFSTFWVSLFLEMGGESKPGGVRGGQGVRHGIRKEQGEKKTKVRFFFWAAQGMNTAKKGGVHVKGE